MPITHVRSAFVEIDLGDLTDIDQDVVLTPFIPNLIMITAYGQVRDDYSLSGWVFKYEDDRWYMSYNDRDYNIREVDVNGGLVVSFKMSEDLLDEESENHFDLWEVDRSAYPHVLRRQE